MIVVDGEEDRVEVSKSRSFKLYLSIWAGEVREVAGASSNVLRRVSFLLATEA